MRVSRRRLCVETADGGGRVRRGRRRRWEREERRWRGRRRLRERHPLLGEKLSLARAFSYRFIVMWTVCTRMLVKRRASQIRRLLFFSSRVASFVLFFIPIWSSAQHGRRSLTSNYHLLRQPRVVCRIRVSCMVRAGCEGLLPYKFLVFSYNKNYTFCMSIEREA